MALHVFGFDWGSWDVYCLVISMLDIVFDSMSNGVAMRYR